MGNGCSQERHNRQSTSLIKDSLDKDGEEKLTDFVTEVYNHVKLKHSPAELARHELDIRTHIVQPICDTLSSSHPALAVWDVHLNGSMSNQTKIETPNELDYVLPMVHSDYIEFFKNETSDKKYKCKVHPSQCPKLSQYSRFIDSSCLLSNQLIRKFLPQVVKESLSLLDRNSENSLIYKGEIKLKGNPIESSKLSIHEVELDTEVHGPSIHLRVGGLLCVTDIDLCFCLKMLELPHTSRRFYIVVPDYNGWIRSYYEIPDERVKRLDEHHRKIAVTLKYILSQVKKHKWKSRFHSHALFTLVRKHQAQCDSSDRSLGKCYNDINHSVCKLVIKSMENNKYRYVELDKTLHENIKDIECPELSLLKPAKSIPTDLFVFATYNLTKLKASKMCSSGYRCTNLIDLVIRECWLELMKQWALQKNSKVKSSVRNLILSAENGQQFRKLIDQYGVSIGVYEGLVVDVQRLLSRLKEKISSQSELIDIETWLKRDTGYIEPTKSSKK